MHSWIVVCCPLPTFHNNSVCTFAALSRVAQYIWPGSEIPTHLWETTEPPLSLFLSCLNSCIWGQYTSVLKTLNLLTYIEKWAQGKFKFLKSYRMGRIKLLLRKIPSAEFHLEFGWESCLNLILKHSCEAHEDVTSVAHPTTLEPPGKVITAPIVSSNSNRLLCFILLATPCWAPAIPDMKIFSYPTWFQLLLPTSYSYLKGKGKILT